MWLGFRDGGLASDTGLILAVVIIVGFICFVVVSGFRSNFLSADFYTENIAENSVYDRIYDEVLLDPEFERQTDYLVAGVEVPHEDVIEVTRSILPPAYLEAQVENALSSALDYLKRDSEEALVFIELAEPIDKIKPTLLAYIDRRIDEIPTKRRSPTLKKWRTNSPFSGLALKRVTLQKPSRRCATRRR